MLSPSSIPSTRHKRRKIPRRRNYMQYEAMWMFFLFFFNFHSPSHFSPQVLFFSWFSLLMVNFLSENYLFIYIVPAFKCCSDVILFLSQVLKFDGEGNFRCLTLKVIFPTYISYLIVYIIFHVFVSHFCLLIDFCLITILLILSCLLFI